MRVYDFYENDEEHRQALNKTGFWGRQGAGCIIMAKDTKRFCIAHRSKYVEQPNTWGTWGGAIDSGEDPKVAAAREVKEEAGYHGSMHLIPLYVFKHESGFTYYNFLAIVESEFEPSLDWETQGFEWVNFGDWPSPMHPGLQRLLSDPASIRTLEKASNSDQKNVSENKKVKLANNSTTQRKKYFNIMELYETLKARGFKNIGSGIDQTAWLHPTTGLVWKVFFGDRPDSLLRFAEYCKSNPTNPMLPNFQSIRRGELENGKEFYVTISERLFPINHPFWRSGLATIARYIDKFNKHKSQTDLYNEILSFVQEGESLDQKNASSTDYAELLTHIGTPSKNIQKPVQIFIKTITDLSKLGDSYGFELDLHGNNFMFGSDGTIVINDPWVDF